MRNLLSGLRRGAREEGGQGMVEFAVAFPVILLIVFSVIQFTILMHDDMVVAGAARVGARTASIAAPRDANWQSEVEAAVDQTLQQGGLSGAGTNEWNPQWPYASGDLTIQQGIMGGGFTDVTVMVTYHQPTIVPWIGTLFGHDPSPFSTNTNLVQAVTMVEEQIP